MLTYQNQRNNLMQITIGQSKTRESAQQYLKIEQNTEYLTHLIRYSTNKRRVYLRPDMNPPDLRSIAALTVQLSYLLFTCYVKHVTVLISQKFMLLNPLKRQVNPQICCEYIFQKDFLTLREEQQKIIAQNFARHEFSSSEMWAYGRYTLNYVKSMLELVKPQLQRLKTAADKILAKQFLNLQAIKNFLQARLQSIQHPRIVILSFQESQIFREYSILVKVMNNSIFSSIKSSKFKGIFSQICTMQYNLSRSKDKNKTFLEAYSLEIEASIEELMRALIKSEVIMIEQSLNNTQDKMIPQEMMRMGGTAPGRNVGSPINPTGQMRSPQNVQQGQSNQPIQGNQLNQNANILNNINKTLHQTTKPYILGDVQDMNHPDRKYTCKVQLNEKSWRPFSNKVYQTLRFQALNNYNTSQKKMQEQNQAKEQNKDPRQVIIVGKNQFIIQFTPVKGLLVVKYITPIELNIENTDLVMFQCNNIAYHWSQVSMELVEKSANKLIKKKERYLALKTITHLHIADRPLFKLLLMLDLVMLCAKIAEPELKRNVIKAQDYSRIQEISLKVNHMINLFIRKIERYYKILSQAENANKKGV